jgi:pimeloyl-ACP methyl ester carboxylesterase
MNAPSYKSHFVEVNGIHLHYLDWGSNEPVLLFLAGMGCSAYIFKQFAPRFTDKFHVLALDRRGHGDSDYPETGYDPDTLTEDLRQFLDVLNINQVILVGHSMGYIELCHFTALYPERVLKLIFLDAAYDMSAPETQAVLAKDPLPNIMPPWPDEQPNTIEEYIATTIRLYPFWAAIAGQVMDEQTKHSVKTNADGKIVPKIKDVISKEINDTFASYSPEFSTIQVPVLSFFAMPDGSDFLSSDYMSEDQKKEVIDFIQTVLIPDRRKYIDKFQQNIPQAKIVEISNGHHYCFIKQEETVFDEMMKFLLQSYSAVAQA